MENHILLLGKQKTPHASEGIKQKMYPFLSGDTIVQSLIETWKMLTISYLVFF
jgi:hypothetical protein